MYKLESNHALFAVGEFEDRLLEFGLSERLGASSSSASSGAERKKYKRTAKAKAKGGRAYRSPTSEKLGKTPGLRKAFTRNVGGKLQYVKQTAIKARKSTAGALKSGGGTAWRAAKGAGKTAGSFIAQKGGQGLELAKANPRISAGVGGGAAALGAGYAGYRFLTRKKKRRG